MATWNKKDVAKELVMSLHTKYGTDLLTSSILARRNIISGTEVQYFLEDDKRFLHCPFLFDSMEDACDRITSTTLLYQYLKSIGIDVQYKIPSGDDDFGLSIEAIDNFAANYGTLIITVDNGIFCKKEVVVAGVFTVCYEILVLASMVAIMPVSFVSFFMRLSAPLVMVFSAIKFREQSVKNQLIFGCLALILALPMMFVAR